MFVRSLRLTTVLFSNQYNHNNYSVPQRNVQISVVGAASEVGSNVSMLLKVNPKVKHLKLYDDDIKVLGIGIELSHIPGGASVTTYAGDCNLGASLRGSHIIMVTNRTSRKLGNTREEMIAANAPAIKHVCRAMVNNNPHAFLAISTNPINCIIPFASGLLHKYNSYNPYKVLGVTHIDTARTQAFAGEALQMSPRDIQVPVIGAHSDETIIPLFSNITPFYEIDQCQAESLTRIIRKAGTEVIVRKQGSDSAVIAMVWSIHEFLEGLIDAVCGSKAVLNCYTANPHFGTRFFAGPTIVGCQGVLQTCSAFSMTDYESYLLSAAIPLINRDVAYGEEYV